MTSNVIDMLASVKLKSKREFFLMSNTANVFITLCNTPRGMSWKLVKVYAIRKSLVILMIPRIPAIFEESLDFITTCRSIEILAHTL